MAHEEPLSPREGEGDAQGSDVARDDRVDRIGAADPAPQGREVQGKPGEERELAPEVSSAGLAVTRGMRGFEGTRSLSLDEIASAEPVRLRGGMRVRGTGLPGYCAGHFRYQELGDVWQATDCSSRGVVIRRVDPSGMNGVSSVASSPSP
jgi:hypothetical protein